MTSTRLPEKVMLPLCGKTVLEIMFDRLKEFKKNIIIATTNDGTQQPIIRTCQRNGIRVYEGDTEDVLSRYYEAASLFGAKENDAIVRLTSDCPLIDPDIVQKTINYYFENDLDLAGAGPHSGYPRGMDTTVFKFKWLEYMHFHAIEKYDREHVTPYFGKIKTNLKIDNLFNNPDESHYRLTLDEPDDYTVIKEVYKQFNCSIDFTYRELINMLKENPYIVDINKHVKQKNGTK